VYGVRAVQALRGLSISMVLVLSECFHPSGNSSCSSSLPTGIRMQACAGGGGGVRVCVWGGAGQSRAVCLFRGGGVCFPAVAYRGAPLLMPNALFLFLSSHMVCHGVHMGHGVGHAGAGGGRGRQGAVRAISN
jgi:hypothetical protein